MSSSHFIVASDVSGPNPNDMRQKAWFYSYVILEAGPESYHLRKFIGKVPKEFWTDSNTAEEWALNKLLDHCKRQGITPKQIFCDNEAAVKSVRNQNRLSAFQLVHVTGNGHPLHRLADHLSRENRLKHKVDYREQETRPWKSFGCKYDPPMVLMGKPTNYWHPDGTYKLKPWEKQKQSNRFDIVPFLDKLKDFSIVQLINHPENINRPVNTHLITQLKKKYGKKIGLALLAYWNLYRPDSKYRPAINYKVSGEYGQNYLHDQAVTEILTITCPVFRNSKKQMNKALELAQKIGLLTKNGKGHWHIHNPVEVTKSIMSQQPVTLERVGIVEGKIGSDFDRLSEKVQAEITQVQENRDLQSRVYGWDSKVRINLFPKKNGSVTPYPTTVSDIKRAYQSMIAMTLGEKGNGTIVSIETITGVAQTSSDGFNGARNSFLETHISYVNLDRWHMDKIRDLQRLGGHRFQTVDNSLIKNKFENSADLIVNLCNQYESKMVTLPGCSIPVPMIEVVERQIHKYSGWATERCRGYVPAKFRKKIDPTFTAESTITKSNLSEIDKATLVSRLKSGHNLVTGKRSGRVVRSAQPKTLISKSKVHGQNARFRYKVTLDENHSKLSPEEKLLALERECWSNPAHYSFKLVLENLAIKLQEDENLAQARSMNEGSVLDDVRVEVENNSNFIHDLVNKPGPFSVTTWKRVRGLSRLSKLKLDSERGNFTLR
jgi:hypothetical protein